jgi:hypothetical protein
VGFAYIYLKRDIYTDEPINEREFKKEVKEDEKWYDANVKTIVSLPYIKLEMLSDFILQIYALMLFSSFWEFINRAAIQRLHDEVNRDFFDHHSKIIKIIDPANFHTNTGAGLGILLLLFITVMIGLMPIRIAYWVEDSMTAFTKKETLVMWTIFAIAAIYTCSPFLTEYIAMTKFDAPPHSVPDYVSYIIAISFFLTLLLLQLFWIGRSKSLGKTIDS